MILNNEKYKHWYNLLLEQLDGEYKSIKIDYVNYPIANDEMVVVLRDLHKLFNCSNKTVYRFIDFLVNENYISKRVIGNGNKRKVVVKFLKKEMSTKGNADEQRKVDVFFDNFNYFEKKKCPLRVTLMNKGIEEFWSSKDSDFLKNSVSTKGNADEQREVEVFDNIPKNLLSKKAIEVINANPEIVNKNIQRWVTNNIKNSKQKKVEHTTSYIQCRDMYFEFFKGRNDGREPKFNGVSGAKLKSIIKHLERVVIAKKPIVKDDKKELDKMVVESFQYIFVNWNKLDDFWQQHTDLSTIDSKFDTILNQIKRNGKSKQTTSNENYNRTTNVSQDYMEKVLRDLYD
jgi:hypothetical protein